MQVKKYIGKALFILVVAALSTNFSVAQKKTVCGIVKAFNKYTLRSVKVSARKSDQFITTDSTGRFCIECREKDKLIFKAKGFYTERVRIKDKDSVIINMAFKGGKKNKRIATGLGYIDEDDLTYATSSLENTDKDFGNYSSIYDLIQGELAGVDVVNQTITIRGMDTFDSTPLFVVDGTYRDDISNIHPLDVRSVKVIKGAGTSMYGSRGSNGVIVIETKQQ
jgi:TonB-dependent SusC/RagA subfamily outer membrane receptor